MQKLVVAALRNRHAIYFSGDGPRGWKDLDSFVRVLWMAIYRHVFFEPLIYEN